jgi:hypothetical protein
MIGEAVPPLLTRLHGKVLQALLQGKPASAPLSGERETLPAADQKAAIGDTTDSGHDSAPDEPGTQRFWRPVSRRADVARPQSRQQDDRGPNGGPPPPSRAVRMAPPREAPRQSRFRLAQAPGSRIRGRLLLARTRLRQKPDPEEKRRVLGEKFAETRRRDARNRRLLRQCGWTVLQIWECKLARSPDTCAKRIRSALDPS